MSPRWTQGLLTKSCGHAPRPVLVLFSLSYCVFLWLKLQENLDIYLLFLFICLFRGSFYFLATQYPFYTSFHYNAPVFLWENHHHTLCLGHVLQAKLISSLGGKAVHVTQICPIRESHSPGLIICSDKRMRWNSD